MSMDLNLVYTEAFRSRTGKTLTYSDRVRMWHTSGNDAYDLIAPTNAEILSKYVAYQRKKLDEVGGPELLHDYSTADTLAMFHNEKTEAECVPVRTYTAIDQHIEEIDAFIEKYGGIENVEFYVS